MFGLPVHCQRCDRRLTAADDAAACRHGCTFCPRCAGELGSVCPNCSGELVRRPAAAGVNAQLLDATARGLSRADL